LTRAQVAKGKQWQRDVRVWAASHGWAVHARSSGEAGDDLAVEAGRVRLSVECKNAQAHNLAGWVDQAVAQRRDAGSLPLLVVKRRGKPLVSDAYVVMRGCDFALLLKAVAR
jgi:Holliday junction resolvase